MRVLAVDPGNEESAFVMPHSPSVGRMFNFGKIENALALKLVESEGKYSGTDHLAIEMIASYGMPVGREVFETCVWIGRFIQAWGRKFTLVYRKDVKLHLCGQTRAKDGNVRTSLIDKFGGKAKAIGTKKSPGPLHGMSKDVWAALGVYVTFTETGMGAV